MNDYAQKLNSFNSTEKYAQEIELLKGLLRGSKSILDYGCGTGYTVEQLRKDFDNVEGFDNDRYSADFIYTDKPFGFDTVYFMHSLAHIASHARTLNFLDCNTIVVITPNKDWIDVQNNRYYKGDCTVKQHFTQQDLVNLFDYLGFNIDLIGQFGQKTGAFNERLFVKATRK